MKMSTDLQDDDELLARLLHEEYHGGDPKIIAGDAEFARKLQEEFDMGDVVIFPPKIYF